MKRALLSGILATGLVSLLLAATGASAAGYVHKTFTCPKTGFNLLPAGTAIELEDVVVSTDGMTDVQIFFNPPRIPILTFYLDANETVTASFQGQVESFEEQAVKVTCGGSATVSITLAGQSIGFGT